MDLTNTKSQFQKIIESCKGNTYDLKLSAASYLELTPRHFNRIYNGSVLDIKLSIATRFIEWANMNKVEGARDFTLDDLLTEEELITNS